MDRGCEENEAGRTILATKKGSHSGAFLFLLTNLLLQPKITLMYFRPDDPMVTMTMAMSPVLGVRSMEKLRRVWMAR